MTLLVVPDFTLLSSQPWPSGIAPEEDELPSCLQRRHFLEQRLSSLPFISHFARILLWPQITCVKFKRKDGFLRNVGCEIRLISERKLHP